MDGMVQLLPKGGYNEVKGFELTEDQYQELKSLIWDKIDKFHSYNKYITGTKHISQQGNKTISTRVLPKPKPQ